MTEADGGSAMSRQDNDPASLFARHHPGPDEASLLALTLFDDLLRLLRKKGVLSPDEVTGLLEAAAHRLSQNPNALAKRGGRFIRDAMLPVHESD